MNEPASASDSPFIQGRNARLYGRSADSCPYPEGSQDRQAWLQAYEEAAADDPEGEKGYASGLTLPASGG